MLLTITVECSIKHSSTNDENDNDKKFWAKKFSGWYVYIIFNGVEKQQRVLYKWNKVLVGNSITVRIIRSETPRRRICWDTIIVNCSKEPIFFQFLWLMYWHCLAKGRDFVWSYPRKIGVPGVVLLTSTDDSPILSTWNTAYFGFLFTYARFDTYSHFVQYHR